MSLYPREILEYISLAGIPRGYNSKVFVVDPINGSAANSGDRWTKPVLTLTQAKALCVTGRNDVVLVLASGASAVTEPAALDWSLNQTHILGLGAITRRGKRTRIVPGVTGTSPFFTVSGYGNIIKDVRIVSEFAASILNKIDVAVTGVRNYFENVEFAGPATVGSALDTSCGLYLAGASECMFKNCEIGLESCLGETGAMALVFTNPSSGGLRFENCMIVGYANSTSAGLVEFLAVNCVSRTIVFDRCEFINQGPQTMASAFVVAAGWDPTAKKVFLKDCLGYGFADWEAAAQGAVYLSGGTQTAGGFTGFAQIATTA